MCIIGRIEEVCVFVYVCGSVGVSVCVGVWISELLCFGGEKIGWGGVCITVYCICVCSTYHV